MRRCQDLVERRAERGDLGRDAVHLEIAVVRDHEAPVRGRYMHDAVRHVVERGVEARILAAQLLGRAVELQAALHAVGDRGQDQRGQQAGDEVVGFALGRDGGEDLLGGAAERDDQRVILDGAVHQEAGNAVGQVAFGEEPAGAPGRELVEQARNVNVASRFLADAAAGRPDDAVGADHPDIAFAADLDRIVEPREIGRVERRQDDAAERAVGALDAARELDRGAAGDAADHRLADEQPVLVRIDMDPEVLAVAQVDAGLARDAARAHEAVGPDDDELQQVLVDHLGVVDPGAEIEAGGIAQVVGPHHVERAVDVVQGLRQVGLEGAGEIARILDRGALGALRARW